ncbi:MAG: glycerophosphodiester phosphodiesterase [Ilumatobacteraceae bacterium]
MQQRLPSLLDPPIAFAHRGARAHARENTMEAFRLALRLGATGLESDVWVSADGVPVLDHDGVLGPRWRRRQIGAVDRSDLPDHIPTFDELLDAIDDDVDLSLDLKDAGSGPAVIARLRGRSTERRSRTWLCAPDRSTLLPLRDEGVRLLDSTRLARIKEGPERRAADLAAEGLDGINLRQDDWSGGLAALFHRFGLVAFGWDLHFEHQLRPALRMGLDAVCGDHVDVMMETYRDELGRPELP